MGDAYKMTLMDLVDNIRQFMCVKNIWDFLKRLSWFMN